MTDFGDFFDTLLKLSGKEYTVDDAKDMIKKDASKMALLNISSNVSAIVEILIRTNICTKNEYENLYAKYEEVFLTASANELVKSLNDAAEETAE